MAKHKHVANPTESTVMDTSLAQAEESKLAIEDMPLDTLRDYRLYNEKARRMNKKLKLCRYQIKQCPPDLHPKQRIKFGTTDGSMNPIPVFLSDDKIHYDESLKPGQVYDLPEYIVHYLSNKGYPIWEWINLKDGGRETVMTGTKPRFSLTSIYSGSY